MRLCNGDSQPLILTESYRPPDAIALKGVQNLFNQLWEKAEANGHFVSDDVSYNYYDDTGIASFGIGNTYGNRTIELSYDEENGVRTVEKLAFSEDYLYGTDKALLIGAKFYLDAVHWGGVYHELGEWQPMAAGKDDDNRMDFVPTKVQDTLPVNRFTSPLTHEECGQLTAGFLAMLGKMQLLRSSQPPQRKPGASASDFLTRMAIRLFDPSLKH